MKHTFEEVYQFAQLCYHNSEWAQEMSLKERVQELEKEVQELMAEVGKDNDRFKDELGDVFWDVIHLLIIAEDQGLIKPKQLMENILKKFKKRKSFVLEGKKLTKEEELKLWEEVKKNERNRS